MFPRRFFLAAILALAAGCANAETMINTGLAVEPLDVVTAKGVAHFQVEIADNSDTREIGLMNRPSIAPDRGMLFEFDWPGPQSFWMKDTLIPLDIIFIKPDGRIDRIAENTKPLSLDSVASTAHVNGVLEIGGGRARQLGIKPGDLVRHPFFQRRSEG
jgi:uncharacterized membrane protein (UPF0127 family)